MFFNLNKKGVIMTKNLKNFGKLGTRKETAIHTNAYIVNDILAGAGLDE